MAKQSSVNLDITNNADGFDISGGTTVRKLGITGGDVTIAGSGSAVVTFPTTSTTIAGLGITQSFSALQSFSAGISASGATFSGNISAPNIVTSVNGATGSVTTYAGTTGNIQFRYGSGVTANNYFGLTVGNLGQITDILTLSGATVGFDAYFNGNQQALGLQFERGIYGLGLDEAGGVAITAKGIWNDGLDLYGANLHLATPTSDIGSSIMFHASGGEQFSVNQTSVYSGAQHVFNNGINSQSDGYTNNFAGPITGVTATFTGLLSASKGISASGGFTFGSPSGTTFMVFVPQTSCSNGGLWIRDGNFQIGGSALSAASGAFFYSPCGEQFTVYGYSTFQNSYNYQAGRPPLRLNAAPTQSVPILAAYKQTSDGTQLTNTFTTTNMVAGIDQNGALFSSVGISAAGGITFTNNVQANGYILTSNARSWFL
jgi:hypothetical protein